VADRQPRFHESPDISGAWSRGGEAHVVQAIFSHIPGKTRR
jgi:hypothetical protein